jgi:hypothetical protein
VRNGVIPRLGELARSCRDVGRLTVGALRYLRTGTTPDSVLHSLISLHCQTGGTSTDLLHQIVRLRRPPSAFPHANGVLGNLSQADLSSITAHIEQKSYYVFPQLLPAEICDRLMEFAEHTESAPYPARAGLCPRAIYNRKEPVAEGFKFDEQSLLENHQVQSLVGDFSILSLAQRYLGSQPVSTITTMWWSTSAKFCDEAQSQLAQMYHFDMDHLKWIKIFFYLTDVTSANGPHMIVAGSHRRGAQPSALLRRGYVRISDDEMKQYYPPEAFVELTGPRGTIFAADTRAFHKGKVPESGDRLVLQLEFSDALFGGVHGSPPLPTHCSRTLLDVADRYPRIYARFQR